MKQWRKILWVEQSYPDNYSGGNTIFLSELRRNESAVMYSKREALHGALHFGCHLNAVATYFLLFEAHIARLFSLELLATMFLVFFLVGYFFVHASEDIGLMTIANHSCTLATIVLFGYGLTPIIRTLTTTISTDTVYAMALTCILLSCAFHDYGVSAPLVSPHLSVSCGLSAGVFLVSRETHSFFSSFVMLTTVVALFLYWPLVRNKVFALSTAPPRSSLRGVLYSSLGIASLLGLGWLVSVAAATFWCLLHVFLLAVVPHLLDWRQTLKATIHGPWDEAVPRLAATSS